MNRFTTVFYGNSFLPHSVIIDATLVSAALTLLGASPVVVGLSTLVSDACTILSCLSAPLLLPFFRTRTRMVRVTTALSVLSCAAMAGSLALAHGGGAIAALTGSMALYQLASGARSLPWSDLMRQELSRETRIRVVTQSIVLSLLVATAASWGVKALLDSPLGFPASYVIVFLSCTVSAALALLNVARLRRERPGSGGATAAGFLRVAAREIAGLRSKPEVALTLGGALFYLLAASTAGLYVSAGYARDPVAMARLFGQALVIRTFVKAVAYFLAGRAAERLGNRAVLLAIALAGSVAPLTSLFLPFQYTILILIATNLMPMFDPFVVNILMNVSKDDEFPARYTLYTLVRFPLSLVLPLLGALVERSRAAFDVVVLLSLSLAAFLVTRLPREASLN